MPTAPRTFLVAACAAALLAGIPLSAGAETADELIAKHIAARGGYERLRAVETMRIARTYGTFGGNLAVVITKKRPALLRIEQTLPDGRTVVRGVSASTAWDTTPDGKSTTRPPATATETREIDADFDGLLVGYREKGHTVEYRGPERTGGVDTHKLQITLGSGAVRTIYLDAETYLERKQVGTMTLPQGRKATVTLTFGDYRDVDGLQFPFAIDEERDAYPVQTLAIYTERIELNVPVTDEAFEPPVAPGASSP